MMVAVYAVAERLGVSVRSVLDMPEAELQGWLAFFEEFPRG